MLPFPVSLAPSDSDRNSSFPPGTPVTRSYHPAQHPPRERPLLECELCSHAPGKR
ncbi:hypothetical protein BD779DRAFT_1560542 [Infundibulicybe gibba]|nr:hypothetical protein BD779DRAFT_1560542 [Infundibulicybe gibba]